MKAGSRMAVSSIEGLRGLEDRLHLLPSEAGALSLRFPQLLPETARRWEEKLGRDISACGCETGALFIILSIATCLYCAVGGPLAVSSLRWLSIPIYVGIVVSSGFMGKIIGLLHARIRLRSHLKQLTGILKGQDANRDWTGAVVPPDHDAARMTQGVRPCSKCPSSGERRTTSAGTHKHRGGQSESSGPPGFF